MNVATAASATVHEFNGGAEILGALVGIQAGILRNKVNPHNDRNHLTIDETMRIQRLSGDHRIIQAMAIELGYVMLPLDVQDEPASIEAATRTVLELARAQGDLSSGWLEAIEDDKITRNEQAELSRLAQEMMRGIASFIRAASKLAGG